MCHASSANLAVSGSTVAFSTVSQTPTALQCHWLSRWLSTSPASETSAALKGRKSASTSVHRSWLLIFGPALVVVTMALFEILTKSPCLQVCNALCNKSLRVLTTSDYRIPQMLHALGCLRYSPPLDRHIRKQRDIEPGHPWEVQLRGCSIWCVELLRREILREYPDARVNAVLIDFFLYDTVKGAEGSHEPIIPHHRTKSIWY